jgi:hypothetical protein
MVLKALRLAPPADRVQPGDQVRLLGRNCGQAGPVRRGCASSCAADLTQERIRRCAVLGGLINECDQPRRRPGQELWPSSGTPTGHTASRGHRQAAVRSSGLAARGATASSQHRGLDGSDNHN